MKYIRKKFGIKKKLEKEKIKLVTEFGVLTLISIRTLNLETLFMQSESSSTRTNITFFAFTVLNNN